jgi:hemoglobin-like flavoprotein
LTSTPPSPGLDGAHIVARASYDRCCQAPDFFLCFYRNFFVRRPDVEPMFAHTDFQKQHRLLRHAIGLLLAFPATPSEGPLLLQRVAARHGRDDLKIPADMYADWVDSLLTTVEEHDDEFSPAVGEAWRTTIAPGIAFMQGHA